LSGASIRRRACTPVASVVCVVIIDWRADGRAGNLQGVQKIVYKPKVLNAQEVARAALA
jgi:hypothetical protein